MRKINKTLAVELKKITVTENGCHEWNGSLTRDGYAQLWLNGVNKLVHRLAYEFYKGEIPAGKEISHSCHNRKCCNPDHLRALTHSENLKQSRLDGRLPKKPVHLSQETIKYIHENEMDVSTKELATKYNTCVVTMHRIKKAGKPELVITKLDGNLFDYSQDELALILNSKLQID